jgi:hypothetical protein
MAATDPMATWISPTVADQPASSSDLDWIKQLIQSGNAPSAMLTGAKDVAGSMMSGDAYAPYLQANRNAMAAAEMQSRGAAAAKINAAGLSSQPLGGQIARLTENDLMANRLSGELNNAVAGQNMRQAGANLGLNVNTQEQAGNAQQMDSALRYGGLQESSRSAKAQEGLTATQMVNANNLALRGLDESTRAAKANESLASRSVDVELEKLYADMAGAQTTADLKKAELALQDKLQSRTLDIQERAQTDATALSQVQAALATRAQTSAEKTQIDNLKLATDSLALENKKLTVNEAYNNSQIAIAEKTLSASTAAQMQTLDLQYKQLDETSRQTLAQIYLGKEQLTTQDRQFMTQLGVSQAAQNWTETYQKMQLDAQKVLSDKTFKIQQQQNAIEQAKVENTNPYTWNEYLRNLNGAVPPMDSNPADMEHAYITK